MRIPRLAKTILASGVALAATAAMLGAPNPASATTTTFCSYPTSPPGQPGTATVLLKGVGVDFGTGGLNSSNDPVCAATLTWDTSNSSIRPTLHGDLIQKNNQGVTARVLMSYYDVRNAKLGSSWTDGAHYASSNLQTDHVSLNPYADGSIYRVDVKTQVQQSSGAWTDVASTSKYIGSSTKASDPAKISAIGEDFGGSGGLSSGAPINSGSIGWITAAGPQPTVNGTVYFTNQPGAVARLRLKTYDVRGAVIRDVPLPQVSPSSTKPSGTDAIPVSWTGTINYFTYKAQLSLEILNKTNNTWSQVGSTVTAYI